MRPAAKSPPFIEGLGQIVGTMLGLRTEDRFNSSTITQESERPALTGSFRYFGAFLAGLRKADSDGLLSRLHDTALAGSERAELFSMQGAFDALARSFAIFPSGTFFLSHFISSDWLDLKLPHSAAPGHVFLKLRIRIVWHSSPLSCDLRHFPA